MATVWSSLRATILTQQGFYFCLLLWSFLKKYPKKGAAQVY